MATAITQKPGPFVLVGVQNGITVIPSPTPLTRLNYFDGKFLRAADLQAEQLYLRSLIECSNKAGGHGVAYGFDVSLVGGALRVGHGLAVDAEGRVLLLPQQVSLDVQELIEKSRTMSAITATPALTASSEFGDCVVAGAAPPTMVLESGDLYVITVAHAEALCGEEDVFGKLCEEACVTSTDRPFRVEGVVVRARPLQLLAPLPVSSAVPFDQSHLRSRVAAACFDGERLRIASHISKAGLESAMWCFGAQPDSGSEVPIGVVGLAGAAVLFLDSWIVRRERIDTPAMRYWQWRMQMRPWDVFLAHVLQFQCQLHDLFAAVPPDGGAGDPCAAARSLVVQASEKFDEVTRFYAAVASRLAAINLASLPGGLSALAAFNQRLASAKKVLELPAADRRLIRGGIVELPSAGFLPVVPGSALTVNAQVRQLLGEGVDLRFCIVRPDFVAHALEEAQHLTRISLTQGLDDPSNKPQVDILVPNGEIVQQELRSPGVGWETVIQLLPGGGQASTGLSPAARAALNMRGAARTTLLETGGAAVYEAGVALADETGKVAELAAALSRLGDVRDTAHIDTLRSLSEEAGATGQPATVGAFRPGQAAAAPVAAVWVSASCARDPFSMQVGEMTALDLNLAVAMPAATTVLSNSQWRGDFRADQPASASAGVRRVSGTATLLISSETGGGAPSFQSLRFKATVTHDTVARTFQIELVSVPPALTLRFVCEWQGDPLKARTRIIYRVATGGEIREIVIFDSLLTRNDKVLDPGNPAHTASLSAVEIVGAALNDTGFADAAARLLFPPPPPPSTDIEVRAIADWVLFHRRRPVTCAEEHPLVPAAARRYQVYHLLVPSLESAEKVRQLLLANDDAAIAKLDFRPVDLVEFAAGVPSLNTPASAIQADWQAASPGNRLIYGSIASSGAAAGEGESLALARLGRVEGVVAAVSPPIAQLHSETLTAVPVPLAVPGSDGVIVLLTLQIEAKTTCHAVFRATDPISRITSVLQTEGVPGAIQRGIIAPLGNVQFKEGTTEATGNGLEKVKEQWAKQGNGAIAGSAAVFFTGDQSVSANLRVGQATVILSAIAPGSTPQIVENPVALGVECTTVTVIQASVAQPGPFSFNAQAVALTVRAEGQAELVGDYLLVGSGGSAGQQVTVNFQYFLNTAVTNAATDLPILLINDPPPDKIEDGVNRFTGVRPAGQQNTVVFSGVKLALPGAAATLTLRFAKVRANVSALGGGTTPAQVIALVSISGPAALPINNPQQVVAIASTQANTPPRVGRIFVWEGSPTNRTIAGPRRVTTVNFAPDGNISTPITDEMAVELQRLGPFLAVELATQEAAPDALAKTRTEVVLKDLQTRGLVSASVPASARAVSEADRQLLPGTASTANDIIFLRRG